MSTKTKILELKNINKRFGTVQALKDVNFELTKGEIHGLLGENGAGKSTLMNILYGLYNKDQGQIILREKVIEINSPLDSIKNGIAMIHQSATLVSEFTAVENLVLGMQRSKLNLNFKEEKKEILKLQEEFGLKFPLDIKVKNLSAGLKKKIEIVRAIYRNSSILILDEPTTALIEEEFKQLLSSLKKMVSDGLTIIFITHKIKEVLQACDRATVLTDGIIQGTLNTKNANKEDLVNLMFKDQKIDINASAIPLIELPKTNKTKEPVLSIEELTTKSNKKDKINLVDLNMEIYGGEIFGIAGISGNGQKELAEVIIKPDNIVKGKIKLKDKVLNGLSTVEIFDLRVFYIPEDRKRESILGQGDIKDNILLGHQRESRFQKSNILRWDKVKEAAKETIDHYQVKTPDENKEIEKLSGGNIQRVVIGRALLNDLDLLVTHSPTAGLDISSVKFIFEKIIELRSKKTAILYLNEDLDELIEISDRIGVIYEGRLVEIYTREQFNKHKIGSKMIGG
ncbi:MAG: ABC transporter ATP-binding protein [Halanaerobiales bacterium]|nr:ABC transporter ATP-binding protein [Halanaerobiales bacterium]